jgi:hypothetical protein
MVKATQQEAAETTAYNDGGDIMTSIGIVIVILAIGLLVFNLLRSGGGCHRGGQQEDRHDHAGPVQAAGSDTETKKRHKGGCCS